jgi:hypothetical protein
MLGPIPQPAAVNADGAFVLENVAPGEYQVSIPGIPPALGPAASAGPPFYLKEAKFGAVDVLRESLTISGPASAELQLVLASDAGQVTGQVTDAHEQPVTPVQIVLVPDRHERRDLYKIGVTDARGTFTLRNVPPGTYRAFAVDSTLMQSFFDPAIMQKLEPSGRSLTVSSSASVNVNLKVISNISR